MAKLVRSAHRLHRFQLHKVLPSCTTWKREGDGAWRIVARNTSHLGPSQFCHVLSHLTTCHMSHTWIQTSEHNLSNSVLYSVISVISFNDTKALKALKVEMRCVSCRPHIPLQDRSNPPFWRFVTTCRKLIQVNEWTAVTWHGIHCTQGFSIRTAKTNRAIWRGKSAQTLPTLRTVVHCVCQWISEPLNSQAVQNQIQH